MKAFLKRFAAMLACAVGVAGIANPFPPASPLASVASAQAPTVEVVAPSTPSTPTPAPLAPTPDPLPAFVVKLEGPAKATGGFAVFVTKPPAAVCRWRNELPAGSIPVELTDNTGRTVLCFFSPAPGVHKFSLSAQLAVDGLDPFAEASLTVDVGGAIVVPESPPVVVPPVDQPADGEAAKVKTPGFRCLLLYEHMKGIPDVFADREVCKYLDTHVVKGEDGKTPEWRRKDNDEPATGDFAVWKLYRETLPDGSNEGNFVSCGNGVIGYAGPAPKTGAELLALLKKYGGE